MSADEMIEALGREVAEDRRRTVFSGFGVIDPRWTPRIDKIADGWPASRADELLPRRWLEARKAEQQTDGNAVAPCAIAAVA